MSDRQSIRPTPLLFVYVMVILWSGASLWLIARFGQRLEISNSAASHAIGSSAMLVPAVTAALRRNLASPIAMLVLQILAILTVSRICAVAMRWFGQPRVMGEILAGLALGPSLFGLVAPRAQQLLFPADMLSPLFLLSNFGLILFMFAVGLELNPRAFAPRARSALLISHMSIIVPFVLGAGLALLLFNEFGSRQTGFIPFALFLAISMSVTAFPVLARILHEHQLTQSTIGIAAITAAAIGDVTAWCILAVVVGVVQSGSAPGAAVVVLLAVVYTGFALFAVRPALPVLLCRPSRDDGEIGVTSPLLVCMILFASCLATEAIGIHVLFGAFIAGVIMPEQGGFRAKLIARVHDLSTLILLPLFFAYTGLRTEVGLLTDAHAWSICALIIFVAMLGKIGGGSLAARWTGFSWREAAGVGALMNTRGLVELIVLNIGYDLGVLPPKIFAMLVIMAVATTLMTGPLLWMLGIVRSAAAYAR